MNPHEFVLRTWKPGQDSTSYRSQAQAAALLLRRKRSQEPDQPQETPGSLFLSPKMNGLFLPEVSTSSFSLCKWDDVIAAENTVKTGKIPGADAAILGQNLVLLIRLRSLKQKPECMGRKSSGGRIKASCRTMKVGNTGQVQGLVCCGQSLARWGHEAGWGREGKRRQGQIWKSPGTT